MAQDSDAPTLAMVAGEASGDLLGGLLLQGLQRRWPHLQAAGIGGESMTRQGFDAWWPSQRLAVRGYAEVLRHYRGIVRIRNELRARLLRERPSLFVGIDAPDFNLDLEVQLREAGIRTVHFVCPSIWAWRPGRVAKIARAADHVLCVFPFEPPLLAQHGIDATYVGHPLADVIPTMPDATAARQRLGLSADRPVVALLPGSRASEIDHLAARFVEAARRMQAEQPGLQFVLPAVPDQRGRIDGIVARHGMAASVTVVTGQSHATLAACDVALVASGTATLEAALFRRPMVIAYHMHPLSWWIMRGKRLQPWVGLPNILCEDFVVPEFLQQACTPANLARATLDWLRDGARAERTRERLGQLHERLRRDTARLATDTIARLCDARPS